MSILNLSFMETTIQELEKLVKEILSEWAATDSDSIKDWFWKSLKPHLTSLLTSKDKEIERLQGEAEYWKEKFNIAQLDYAKSEESKRPSES